MLLKIVIGKCYPSFNTHWQSCFLKFSFILSSTSMCIEAILAKILSCSASRMEQALCYFLMSTVKAKDVRESGEQVHYRGEGDRRFVLIEMLERVIIKFRKRLCQYVLNEEQYLPNTIFKTKYSKTITVWANWADHTSDYKKLGIHRQIAKIRNK